MILQWCISALLFLIGAYWVWVEIGLAEKTLFLPLGIIFLIPLIWLVYLTFRE